MNHKIVYFVVLVTILSCGNNQDNNNSFALKKESIDSMSVNKRIYMLFEIENKQTFLLSEEEENNFFGALPNSFEEFKEFYERSYQLDDGRNLYLSYDHHFLILLPNLYYIEKVEILKKLINLSLNGNWDADQISALQRCIQFKFAVEVKAACDILSGFPETEILKFWVFYFDGPHPENYQKDFEELYQRYRTENVEIAELMKRTYTELLRNSEAHAH
ncbi:hypothetical protein ACFSKL_06935 [Belliella marina]|uniref:DUF4476 domain-containing protein n=1 Tax=Belliella marina TaxID=1644146 RepID=A0ABW4VLA1_9BACT